MITKVNIIVYDQVLQYNNEFNVIVKYFKLVFAVFHIKDSDKKTWQIKSNKTLEIMCQ